MTYEELIELYPWVDVAMEMFKGIAPTVIAIVTIFITEFFVRKRDKIHKKKDMKFQYLEKILSWIHETKKCMFEISSALGKVIVIKDPFEKVPKFNEVLAMITEMNKSIAIWSDTYKEVTLVWGYDFKLDQFKEAVNSYSEKMVAIGEKYLEIINTENSNDEINCVIEETNIKMKESISLLADAFNKLY